MEQTQEIQTQNKDELLFRREIKTYVLRIGRMTDAQERAYKELSAKWCIQFNENEKLDFKKFMGMIILS